MCFWIFWCTYHVKLNHGGIIFSKMISNKKIRNLVIPLELKFHAHRCHSRHGCNLVQSQYQEHLGIQSNVLPPLFHCCTSPLWSWSHLPPRNQAVPEPIEFPEQLSNQTHPRKKNKNLEGVLEAVNKKLIQSKTSVELPAPDVDMLHKHSGHCYSTELTGGLSCFKPWDVFFTSLH